MECVAGTWLVALVVQRGGESHLVILIPTPAFGAVRRISVRKAVHFSHAQFEGRIYGFIVHSVAEATHLRIGRAMLRLQLRMLRGALTYRRVDVHVDLSALLVRRGHLLVVILKTT